jgi:site-specific recombinase XerD
MTALAPTLQAFFTDRLIAQRHASPHTIRSYRDTMRLLLDFAQHRLRIPPARLDLAVLDADVIAAFLDHLEHERENTIGTRNARLAAIHSLYTFASLHHPEHAALIARVLAIPPKRHDRRIITHLTDSEIDALLAAPDTNTWIGRRDRAMFQLAIETGLRVSELTGLTRADTHLGTPAHVACHGKGRKDRVTPLTKPTTAILRDWLKERGGLPADPLFPTSRGTPLTRDAVARRLAAHGATAADDCPTLHDKTITPHVLRHTAAMRLLRAGVDTAVIALWLGHEQVDTTQIYLQADLAIKERALALTRPTTTKPGRYKPTDTLIAFLEAL